MITQQQQNRINAAAELVTKTIERANGDMMVAVSILAHELLDAHDMIGTLAPVVEDFRRQQAERVAS